MQKPVKYQVLNSPIRSHANTFNFEIDIVPFSVPKSKTQAGLLARRRAQARPCGLVSHRDRRKAASQTQENNKETLLLV